VQNYRATKKDEPDEFISSLKKQEANPDLAELRKMNMADSVGGQSVEWKNKFCRRGGHNHLFLLLSKLISNAKQTGNSDETMAVISEVPGVLNHLVALEEGLAAVTENQSVQILVRTMDFVTPAAQNVTMKLLGTIFVGGKVCGMCFLVCEKVLMPIKRTRGKGAVMAALDQFVDGSTYWGEVDWVF
jgi:hypothetical protein